MSEELENSTPSLRETIEEVAVDMPDFPEDEISEAAAEETTSANVPDEVGEIEAAEAPPQEVAQSIEPPNSWRADKKEAWKQLPSDVQEYVAQRESERDAYLNQKGQRYSELDKVFEPLENDWQRAGLSPAKVVTQLLAWDKHLREKPLDAIQELASRAGIDLAQFAQVQQAQGPQDPYVRYTLAEVQRMKAEQEQERERIAYEREQQTYQGLNAEIEKFRLSTKDGKPAFPHFDSVREDMATLLPLITKANPNAPTSDILKDAYERAVRANPVTFEAYRKEQESQREQENRKRMQAKKNAGSSLSGSPEGGTIQKPMSIREAAEAAYHGRL